MLLTVSELVYLLRSSVNVSLPVMNEEGEITDTETDPNYLTMTDDDLTLFIKLGASRAFPYVSALDHLPEGADFPVVLLAQIELYMKLAVTYAPKVDLGADNNNYLKQSQKFDHYLKLAQEAQKRYDDWLDSDGADVLGTNTVNTYDVLLAKRHYSQRNYEKQAVPKVSIYVDDVTQSDVTVVWGVLYSSAFARFKVFIDTKPIVDFKRGTTYDKCVSDTALLLRSTSDFRSVIHSVHGLAPETEYHIAVLSIERNSVFGFDEVTFTTLSDPAEEEDVSVETL